MGNTDYNLHTINKISSKFLLYVRPIWYFHLNPYAGENRVWVNFDQLSKVEKELIQYDKDYSKSILSHWDASYQALMKGIVKHTGNYTQADDVELLPSDIYRFMRRFHKKVWLYITFIERLLFFYNPIRELLGLWQTRNVKNINLFNILVT